MIKLTDLDKKILFELDKDGRASFSKIAKTLGTSPQVVKYRFARLAEYGAIKHFWAFVDYDKAGYPFFWGYWMKFSGLTAGREEEMYAKFQANKYIPIVMRSDGYADCMIAIIAKDVFHHNEILQGLFNEYGKYITMSEMVVGVGFVKFLRSHLVDEENKEGVSSLSGGTTEKAELTEVERKMLSLLQIDGRMEFVEMAKIIGVTPAIIHRYYARLVRRGVITRITYTFNYDAVGLKLFRVLFKIKQFQKERIDALYDFCLKDPNIVNYVKVMGNWQLMLDIETGNLDELRDLLRRMKHDFNDIIFEIEVNEIWKVDKFTQMAVEYPELGKNNPKTL
ncbi:MAG: Lrp/AsnC family transcriptional regulator [Candidatus Moranbacteria bacterium]|nr:Lrp/AsnC family transcriptional regulator [Candidatus Moranbacteria bacterium]